MSSYSILLLKKNNSGVSQFHFGSALLVFFLVLLLGGASALGALFYLQNQTIHTQTQTILEQETEQAKLQRRIDMYDGRESRINFLEDYVEELKHDAYNSEITLKKHLALMNSSITKLAELQDYMCGAFRVNCNSNRLDPRNSRQVVQWFDQVQRDFEQMDQSLREFSLKRETFEEQANTIEELRAQITLMEQNLAEHVEFIKVNQDTVDRLSKKISKATGIVLNRKGAKQPAAKSKKGRGGPSAWDTMTLENPQTLFQPGLLRNFLYRESEPFDESVASLEGLSQSIENNYKTWRHTPTLIPTRSRLLSDRFGKRRDPFTGKLEFHAGLDFVARRDSQIYAPADGVVRLAKRHYGFGKMVELEHGRGFFPSQKKTVRYRTRFAHLSKILVKRRQRISRGDVVGLVGSTGRSTGPHLHYEILTNNRRTDPLTLIKRFNGDQRLYVR